jgi:Tol biopolymer transport system component
LARHIRKPPGNIGGHWAFAVSKNVLVYSTAEPARFQFSSVNRAGRLLTAHRNSALTDEAWSLSEDGARVAFKQVNPETGRGRIWILDLVRNQMSPFTSDDNDRYPIWAPSGDQVFFRRATNDMQELYLKRIGSDTETRIGESTATSKFPQAWHPNGRTLLFRTNMPPNNQGNFWLLDTEKEKPPELWFGSVWDHGRAEFSPNGRWVVYQSTEAGVAEIFIRRFPEGDGQEKISTDGGIQPHWRKDGKAIFYIKAGKLMEVDVENGATNGGPPRTLFDLDARYGYAVLPDNRGFLLRRPVDSVPPPTITVVLNWTAGLEKR